MNLLLKMVREGKVGALCKRGAFLIAGLGLIQVIIQAYALWQMYHQLQITTPMASYNDYYIILYTSSAVLTGLIQVIFYTLALYTAGAIIDMVFKQPAEPQADANDEVEFESLGDDDVIYIDS